MELLECVVSEDIITEIKGVAFNQSC